ncbi:hypothetical protein NBRC116188_15260 [Oceaniserpentilla sp. 4NH20-0058]|uniref:hypothetical protein n=1 Tax=Oceaniserpentilla sp. 4NH20-0058 TaxID=3127660 RepID=UPI003104F9A6
MKVFNQNLLWVSIATLALTGCGSSDDSNNEIDDEHEHDHEISILVSQANTSTLSLLEEGELEALDDAAADNSATLVLSQTGAYSAVLASDTVNFVHGLHEDEEEGEHEEEGHEEGEHEEEAHVIDFSLTASQVITTNGHFSMLDSGSSVFVAYDDLETITDASEGTSDLSVVETYPALILDEEHDLKLLFDGVDALLYEGTTEETNFTCANPSGHGQTGELVVVACEAGSVALVIEESETEHTFTDSVLTLDGTGANYQWRAKGGVIVGYEPSTSNYAIVELDETTGDIQLVTGSQDVTHDFSQNICDLQLDSESQDVLALSENGHFAVLNHEGEALKNIVLDESSATECGDLIMAVAAKTAIVVDNSVQQGYEIDVDDVESNPSGYHVHERFDLTVNDVHNMVIFHEIEEGEHEH